MKKIIVIIISSFLFIVFLGALYFFFFLREGGSETENTVGAPQLLFPEGETLNPQFGDGSEEQEMQNNNDFGTDFSGVPTATLIQIAEGGVVSGAVSKTTSGDTSTTTVRYVLRGTGNIFSYIVEKNERKRESLTTIPGIRASHWLPDNRQVLQYVSEGIVESYSSRISGEALTGAYLPRNLSGVATNRATPSGIFVLRQTTSGSAGSVVRPDGSTLREGFSTPLSEITVSWPHPDHALVTTKPSGLADGYAFLVRLGTNVFEKILGPIPGLTALMNDQRTGVVLSRSTTNNFVFGYYDTEKREITSLPLNTLPEKCVWTTRGDELYCGVPLRTPRGVYPDDWYQGVVSFEDRIWKFNVVDGYAELVTELTTKTGGAIDVINPSITEDGTYMIFVDKKTGALWGLSL